MVGTQALFNVLTKERYKMVPKEIKDYVKGMYGKAPIEISKEIVEKIIQDETRITVRPADLLENEFEKLKLEIGDLAKNDEDVLTYALFPQVGYDFLVSKYQTAKVDENEIKSITVTM